jgi:hypothetical protein
MMEESPMEKEKHMHCAFCRSVLDVTGTVGRRDSCPQCNRDLHCCKQCKFYDPGAYNDCREVSSERIIEKERANHCDYFALRGSKGSGSSATRTKDAKKALEALFKKK